MMHGKCLVQGQAWRVPPEEQTTMAVVLRLGEKTPKHRGMCQAWLWEVA